MQYTHTSWIPCINGHLDFGLLKPGIVGGFTRKTMTDSNTSLVNYARTGEPDYHARNIMMQSWVDWKDTKGDKYDGQYRVFTISQVNESDNLDNRFLTGRAYIYPLRDEPNNKTERHELKWFQLIHKATAILKDRKNDFYSKQTKLNDINTELETSLSTRPNTYIVEFKVEPNGIVYLNYAGNAKQLDTYKQYVVMRQVYYYLKYSLHEHKHHDNEIDSLMTIVPFHHSKEHKREASLKLLGQLKRELTSIKRTNSKGHKYEAGNPHGILAYMRSLCTTLYISSFINKKTHDKEINYINSLQQSFDALKEKIDYKNNLIDKLQTKYRTFFGWFLAIISIASFTLFKSFFTIPETDLNNFSYGVTGAATILIMTFTISFAVCKAWLKDKTDTELDNSGFKKWVENHYKVDDKIYRNNRNRETLSWIGVAIWLLSYSYIINLIFELNKLNPL